MISVSRSSTPARGRGARRCPRDRDCAARAARASRGFISSQPCGDRRSRIGTSRVLVRVCQCSTVRPVFRTNGNSALGLLRERLPLGADSFARAVGGLETAIGIEARRAPRARAFRERPLHGARAREQLVADAGVVAEAALRNAPPFVEGVLGPSSSPETVRRGSRACRRRRGRYRSRSALRPAGSTALLTLLTRRSELV